MIMNYKKPLISLASAGFLLALSVNTTSAAIVFNDPSFENGGSLDMAANGNYDAGGGINTSWTALSALNGGGQWTSRILNDGTLTYRNGGLEVSNNYKSGQTTVPAGVTGNQWYRASRADNQSRALMQYVDTGGTSGDVTISIDHWSHELGGGTPSGSTQLAFEIFAFNDPSQVGFMHSSVSGGPYDAIRGTNDGGTTWVAGLNYVTTGTSGFETLDAVDASTGFSTLSKTLSLGAASYQYIGVSITFLGNDANGSAGEVTAIDNLTVTTGSSDTTPPSWAPGYPLVDSVTSSGATAKAQIDETGTAWFVVLADGAAAPDSAEVKAGTGVGGASAVASGSIVLTAGTENTAPITGLAPNTAYDIYFVAEDDESTPNLQGSPALVEITTSTLYAEWSNGGGGFGADDNGDRVDNGMAYVLGASGPGVNATGLLPSFDDSDLDFFIFNYRRSDLAHADTTTTIAAQYGTTLDNWTTAVDDATDVIITEINDDYAAGVDRVEVKLRRSALAPGGRLFVRLQATTL